MLYEEAMVQEPKTGRIDEDANGPRSTFEEIQVGVDLGAIKWTVTKELIDVQCQLDQDFDEWYAVDSPFGSVIAPPQIQYRPPRWLLSRSFNVRGLFYKWEVENFHPIIEGVTLTITGKIVDKYIRNEREYITYEAEAADQKGELIFRTRRTHVLDPLPRTIPRSGKGIDSGIKSEQI